ncbi:zinc finger CCCH domain-containing protein 25-like isoform X1 [Cucumis melo var. makuwa]|uniref:Zinc finger CCCH domain-containing protein 25-like isoform X1 n=1 Tax=Cucumis melo var. makuwa TaxID=1194695 RepID=A0A5A7V2M7_CUCMM|nr:zinc finger CCCH domain-containing protein 25-like isoform X1 [Cucumis melo var. makuwa]
MNPLTLVKRIQKINSQEAALGISEEASWHAKYKDSAYVFVGGIPYDLTEGDLLAVFAQYGEIVDVNLIRDKGTGKSKGYAFVAYEDQRSTNLAVDNLNGAQILGVFVVPFKGVNVLAELVANSPMMSSMLRLELHFKKFDAWRLFVFQRAANTGWGAAEDASSKWGHDKFDSRTNHDKELRAKGRKNSDDLGRHPRETSGSLRQENRPKGWDDSKGSELKPREDHWRRDEKRSRRYDLDGNPDPKLGDDRYKREEKRSTRNHEYDDNRKDEKRSRKHDNDEEMKLEDDRYRKEENRYRRNQDNELPQHSRRNYNTREEDRSSKRHGDEEYQPKLGEDDKRRERDISVRHRSESHRRENPNEKRDFRSSHGGRDSSSHSHTERNEDRRR